VWGGLVAAAGMVALAACGASPSVTTVVARAPARTTGQATAEISEAVATTPSSGAVEHLTATGVVDFGTHRFDLTATTDGQTTEEVLSGSTIYEKSPGVTLLTGKQWGSVSLDALGQLVGLKGLGALVQSGSGDPTAGLQFLSGVTGPVRVVGHEVVRGVPTTHYVVTTSLDLAIARLPAAEQAEVRQFVVNFGVHAAVANVWIDGQGRVRRYHHIVAYHPTNPPAGVTADALPKSVDYTIELYDFGTPATIPVPAASQTGDLTRLLSWGEGVGTTGGAGPAPAGSAAQPLAGVLSDDGGSDARPVLVFDQFVAGYQRMWTNGGNQIIEFVYEFGTPNGAVAYGQRQFAAEDVAPSGDQVGPFAVPGIPGARGLMISGNDGPVDLVLFTRAGFLVEIVMNGTDATEQAATALATAQYGRLSPP